MASNFLESAGVSTVRRCGGIDRLPNISAFNALVGWTGARRDLSRNLNPNMDEDWDESRIFVISPNQNTITIN